MACLAAPDLFAVAVICRLSKSSVRGANHRCVVERIMTITHKESSVRA
jgi:hypothetical protein